MHSILHINPVSGPQEITGLGAKWICKLAVTT